MSSEQTHQATPEQSGTMTPEQSHQNLINEAKAIIQALMPDANPQVVVQSKDTPCGGPAGTDRSSVESDLTVHGCAKDKTLTSGEMFQQVVAVLRKRGRTIDHTMDNVAGVGRGGVGGISAGVSDSPVGISVIGTTECVKNSMGQAS
ncbi:hypothetical protein GCM10017600_76740 [Streptosporangium carneum]|uniref:Uncharacterized protein n=2 Tax=Streptosporangium carneum TaxID=47481 RepID=A0A9W6MHJ9_9ACTN|nr:hypothetical protein GCM10017600_76740 [Streptosporangium carneum]